jgi:FkbM family methyltransferase
MADTEAATISHQRNLSVGRFVTKAIVGAPEVLRCARHFSNWEAFLKHYVAPRHLSEPFVARGRRKFSITHWEASDVQTTWAVFCARNYRLPKGCDVVLDLGANIGVFSTYAVKVAGAKRLIALEPVSSTFAKLRHNLAANGMESMVTAVQKGIAGEVGTRSIFLGVSSPHSSLYYRGNPTFETGTNEDVSLTTLDQLFADFALDRVDVCKMDCEGGEVEALLAASDDVLRRIKCLTMEYHFPGNLSDKRTFFGRLERAGFRCVWQSRIGKMATFVRD